MIDTAAVAQDGHGGGDDAMLHDVVDRLTRWRDGGVDAAPTTGLAHAIESHRMAFAAEQSRHERRLVELDAR